MCSKKRIKKKPKKIELCIQFSNISLCLRVSKDGKFQKNSMKTLLYAYLDQNYVYRPEVFGIIQLKTISFMGLNCMQIESVSGFINPPGYSK